MGRARPGTWPLFILLPASTMIGCYDNFRLVELFESYKLGDLLDLLTGAIMVIICVPYMVVKLYESMDLSAPLLTIFRSSIKIPGFTTYSADIRIFRDTAIVVILSYVLLLDISLSYLWLAFFPAVAIYFIYKLCSKLCPRPGGHRGGEQQPDSAAGRSSTTGDGSDAKAKTTKGSDDQVALMAIAAAPFCGLLGMAQLPDRATAMFTVSQFLLFLSTTLGALTYMMTRLPSGGGGAGVAPASRLLHRASLLALLATVHAVAAEWLGEHVVVFVLLEFTPVLLWFSFHLDRDGSIITVDDIKTRAGIAKSIVITVLGAVVVTLFAYLATSMDELGLSICTTILPSCGISGLLTSYLVFMLRQWPGCNDDAAASDASELATTTTTSPHSKKHGGRGKQITTGSSQEAVRLLMFWANTLLIAAAALLLLQHLVAVRLGLQEPLVDQLFKILNHYADKYLPN